MTITPVSSMKDRVKYAIESNPHLFDDLDNKARRAFLRWLPDNYHIVEASYRIANYLRTHGKREYYSCYMIRERLRWESQFKEIGTGYKISNNMTPFIARLIMAVAPSLKGMFKTKSKKT